MIIVANWKAYVESVSKAKALFASAKKLSVKTDVSIVLVPPAPYLGLLLNGNKSKVAFGAQDISNGTGGAHTGEITAAALREMGVSYAIVGHSERRAAGETDATVFEKAQHALAHGITPILCIGEAVRDEDAHYLQALRAQIAAVFAPLSQKERMQIIVAYEPIWAIGKSAADSITSVDLSEMVLYIRKVLGEYLPGNGAAATTILYGGSVEAGNARALASGSGVDGFLVGHASVDVPTFSALVKAVG